MEHLYRERVERILGFDVPAPVQYVRLVSAAGCLGGGQPRWSRNRRSAARKPATYGAVRSDLSKPCGLAVRER